MIALSPVKSSNIKAIGHDPDTNELHVEFATGGRYVYEGVDADEFAALRDAKSIGSHLHASVKPKKKVRRFEKPKSQD